MKMLALLTLAVIALAPLALARAASDNLAMITQRGRMLFAYDAAAARASDAVVAKTGTKKMPNGAGLYIGHLENGQWVFDFGTLSADGQSFQMFAQAKQNASGLFDAQLFTPPQNGISFDVPAARAINASNADFGLVHRPYNYAILPQADGTMFVYIYPAQTDPNIHPLGGDERYLASADGKTLLDKHRMHQRILEIAPAGPPGAHQVAGFHSDIFGNVPEDTDVFHVLIRRPRIPEYVVAGDEMYLVQIDGTIVDQGKAPQRP